MLLNCLQKKASGEWLELRFRFSSNVAYRISLPDIALGCLDDLRIDHVVRSEVVQAGGRVYVDLFVGLFLL